MDKPTEYQPDWISPPGNTLQETLEALGIDHTAFAARTGLPIDLLNQILEGTAPITPETARAFEKAITTPAEFWLNRESSYQAFLARSGTHPSVPQASCLCPDPQPTGGDAHGTLSRPVNFNHFAGTGKMVNQTAT